jgi:hypothetical protein
MVFRDFGIGSNTEFAFEYSQIKASFRKLKQHIISKTNFIEIQLPEGTTSSYIELCIFMSLVSNKKNLGRELTSSEIRKKQELDYYYGEEVANDIIKSFYNKDTCIAIQLNDEESKIWKKKTHVLNRSKKSIIKLENRKIKGRVWRFFGT